MPLPSLVCWDCTGAAVTDWPAACHVRHAGHVCSEHLVAKHSLQLALHSGWVLQLGAIPLGQCRQGDHTQYWKLSTAADVLAYYAVRMGEVAGGACWTVTSPSGAAYGACVDGWGWNFQSGNV